MAVFFTIGFTIIASGKYPSSGLMQSISIKEAFASKSTPNTLALENQTAQDAASFSWPKVLCLYTGMIVLVSIRRNTTV